jgi:CelD/BcsL family acetyltransferase involved in cellulose biosynthesis
VNVELLDPRRITTRQEGAWRDLAARAAEPNPFFDPALLLPAVRHLPDGPRVRLLVARRAEHWLAALPVLPSRRWRHYPLACTVAWSHPHCFLGTPLLAADDLERATAALADVPRDVTPHPLLILPTVRDDGPVARALRSATEDGTLVDLHHEARAALHRRPENDYVESHRSGKRRREAKRLRTRLAEELGGPPRLRDRGASPAAVERFLALEASGWKGRAATALGSDPAHAAFFRAVCEAPTATVQTHILELGLPDRPAAMLFTLVAGDTAFAVKLAHDERLAHGAPGVQLMTESADWFHAQPTVQRFDSCARPDNAMINALWPDRRSTASLALTVPGLPGVVPRAVLRTYAAAQRHRAGVPAETPASPVRAPVTHAVR